MQFRPLKATFWPFALNRYLAVTRPFVKLQKMYFIKNGDDFTAPQCLEKTFSPETYRGRDGNFNFESAVLVKEVSLLTTKETF